jgi:hypothetical protein
MLVKDLEGRVLTMVILTSEYQNKFKNKFDKKIPNLLKTTVVKNNQNIKELTFS